MRSTEPTTARSVDDVIITRELAARASRPADYAAENEALKALALVMADHPDEVLQKLADLTRALCRADSAGVSILEDEGGQPVFRWRAISGPLSLHVNGTIAKAISPSGVVVDRGELVLFSGIERWFECARGSEPPVFECLLVPWHVDGKTAGTLWAVSHAPGPRFDPEDARLLQSLSRCASAAQRMIAALLGARRAHDEVQRRLGEALSAGRMATWDWDPESDAVNVSESIVETYGLPDNATLRTRRESLALVHPEDVDGLRALMDAAVHSDDGWQAEFRLIRPRDGRTIWLEARGHARTDPHTGKRVMAGVVWDITERKAAEDALRRSREELEARVSDRTRALSAANEWLREEMAERHRAAEKRRDLLRQLVNAQEAERQRISRELHDQLGQQVSTLGLKLAMLRSAPAVDASVRAEIEKLEALSQRLDGDLDFLVWQLRPTALDDLGLASALTDYIDNWSRHFAIASDFECEGVDKGRIDPEVETVLYRIVQEALNNVAKHARATRVRVHLAREGEHILLRVRDDGLGFDGAQAPEAKGLGLIGMRERAALFGGAVGIESTRGAGTAITVRIPVPEDAEIRDAPAGCGEC